MAYCHQGNGVKSTEVSANLKGSIEQALANADSLQNATTTATVSSATTTTTVLGAGTITSPNIQCLQPGLPKTCPPSIIPAFPLPFPQTDSDDSSDWDSSSDESSGSPSSSSSEDEVTQTQIPTQPQSSLNQTTQAQQQPSSQTPFLPQAQPIVREIIGKNGMRTVTENRERIIQEKKRRGEMTQSGVLVTKNETGAKGRGSRKAKKEKSDAPSKESAEIRKQQRDKAKENGITALFLPRKKAPSNRAQRCLGWESVPLETEEQYDLVRHKIYQMKTLYLKRDRDEPERRVEAGTLVKCPDGKVGDDDVMNIGIVEDMHHDKNCSVYKVRVRRCVFLEDVKDLPDDITATRPFGGKGTYAVHYLGITNDMFTISHPRKLELLTDNQHHYAKYELKKDVYLLTVYAGSGNKRKPVGYTYVKPEYYAEEGKEAFLLKWHFTRVPRCRVHSYEKIDDTVPMTPRYLPKSEPDDIVEGGKEERDDDSDRDEDSKKEDGNVSECDSADDENGGEESGAGEDTTTAVSSEDETRDDGDREIKEPIHEFERKRKYDSITNVLNENEHIAEPEAFLDGQHKICTTDKNAKGYPSVAKKCPKHPTSAKAASSATAVTATTTTTTTTTTTAMIQTQPKREPVTASRSSEPSVVAAYRQSMHQKKIESFFPKKVKQMTPNDASEYEEYRRNPDKRRKLYESDLLSTVKRAAETLAVLRNDNEVAKTCESFIALASEYIEPLLGMLDTVPEAVYPSTPLKKEPDYVKDEKNCESIALVEQPNHEMEKEETKKLESGSVIVSNDANGLRREHNEKKRLFEESIEFIDTRDKKIQRRSDPSPVLKKKTTVKHSSGSVSSDEESEKKTTSTKGHGKSVVRKEPVFKSSKNVEKKTHGSKHADREEKKRAMQSSDKKGHCSKKHEERNVKPEKCSDHERRHDHHNHKVEHTSEKKSSKSKNKIAEPRSKDKKKN